MEINADLITGALLLAAGLVLLGWGYRLVRLAMVVAGLVMGAALGYEICRIIGTTGWMTWAGMGVGAVLLAALMPLVRRAGMFMLGSGAGWGMAVLFAGPPHDLPSFAVAAASGVVGGVAILLLEKLLLIVATSYLGAMALVIGFGTLTGIGLSVDRFLSADRHQPPDVPVLALVGVLGLCLAGVGMQLGGARRRRHKER